MCGSNTFICQKVSELEEECTFIALGLSQELTKSWSWCVFVGLCQGFENRRLKWKWKSHEGRSSLSLSATPDGRSALNRFVCAVPRCNSVPLDSSKFDFTFVQQNKQVCWIGPNSTCSITTCVGPSESRRKIAAPHQGQEERYLGDEACNASTGRGTECEKEESPGRLQG